MAKIKLNLWKENVKYDRETNDGYMITGVKYYQGRSAENGKSTGEVVCPCCGETTTVYIWSFAGGGKRCETCRVLLYSSAAFIYKKEIPKGFKLEKN